MKTLLLLLFPVLLGAQTVIFTKQLACPPKNTSTTPLVVVSIVPPGSTTAQVLCYTLDPASFVLDTTNGIVKIIQPAPAAGQTFVDGEVPAGGMNGQNVTFTLAAAPASGSLHLFLNGIRQRLNIDYSLSGQTITFLAGAYFPQGATDQLIADYRK